MPLILHHMHKRVLKDQEDHCDSIPKIELEAARLLARKRDELLRLSGEHITRTIMMTDSMTVLNWINDFDKRFKTFEHFRLKQIRLLTDVSEWRHIPGEHNPADLCGRGLDPLDPKWTYFHQAPPYLKNDE